MLELREVTDNSSYLPKVSELSTHFQTYEAFDSGGANLEQAAAEAKEEKAPPYVFSNFFLTFFYFFFSLPLFFLE